MKKFPLSITYSELSSRSFHLHTKRRRLIGELGTVTKDPLDPDGYVRIDGKRHPARSKNGKRIPAHARIQVVEVYSAVLYVKRVKRRPKRPKQRSVGNVGYSYSRYFQGNRKRRRR